MAKPQKRIKKNKIMFVLILLIVIVGGFLYLNSKNGGKLFDANSDVEDKDTQNDKTEEKKLQIVNQNSKSRPYAIMINNNHEAWPQAGLEDAYIIYEIITEGGITRMLALFKDKESSTKSIGSTRSARHYFLDYALENDAIFVHFGWSPQAQSDISSLGVNNINGLSDSPFWRDNSLKRAYEHTVFTSVNKLSETASKKGYVRNTNKDLLLNYSIDELSISEKEEAKVANNVTIKYSNYQTSSYVYNESDKLYYRSMSGVKNNDLVTGKQYTAKNIIVITVENYSIDSEGRQGLKNIGTGTGYYITDGYAVPIKWKKDSRTSQTIYTYSDGTEITVNDGNTYIQIQPKNQPLTIN